MIVSFHKGSYDEYLENKAVYDADGSIFYCNDRPIIIANGVEYGVSQEIISNNLDGVKDVEFDPETNVITVNYFKETTPPFDITLTKASTTVDGLMSKEDKSNLDSIKRKVDALDAALGGTTISNKFKELSVTSADKSIIVTPGTNGNATNIDVNIDGTSIVRNSNTGKLSVAAQAMTQYLGSQGIKIDGDTANKTVSLIIAAADKVLSVAEGGLRTTLSFGIEKNYSNGSNLSNVTAFVVRGKNNAVIGDVDFSSLVIDKALESVTSEGTNLKFVWNTDAGSKTTVVDLAKYVDIYTAGNGININATGNVVSVKIPTGEKYLEATSNGLATKGIDTAISNAVSTKVNKSGDTMTGPLNVQNGVRLIYDSNFGYLQLGDSTNKKGKVTSMNAVQLASLDIYCVNNALTTNGNKIWHAGNDGAGSGLDADTLDGTHLSAITSAYVTALGTNGNYLTWTKNGTTNNITIPFATTANLLAGNAETAFFRTNRGGIPTAYIDLTTYTAGATGYANYSSGTYTVARSGASDLFVNLAANTGSTSALQFYTSYDNSANLKFRKTIDSNRVSGPWTTVVTNLNVGSYALTTSNYTGTLDTRYVKKAGDTMTGALTATKYIANTAFTPSAGKVTGLTAGTSQLFGNGLVISNPATPNDLAWLRVTGTGEADTVLEIATGDDGGTGEQIVVRQYNTSNAVAKEAKLLDTSGNTSFPGRVNASYFTANGTTLCTNLNADLLDGVHNGDLTAAVVKGTYSGNGGAKQPNAYGTQRVGFFMSNQAVNGSSQYKNWALMDCYSGTDAGGATAIGVGRSNLGVYIMRSAAERTSWAESAELIGTHNYARILNPVYVTSLGTSGNYLTWTKNGVVNNITVPWATTAQNAYDLYHNGGISDFNATNNRNGIYSWSNTAANRPGEFGAMFQWSNVNNPVSGTAQHWITQLASVTDGGGLFYRSRTNTGAWRAWEKILTSVNYATTLNTKYVTLDTTQTISGAKTFTSDVTIGEEKAIKFAKASAVSFDSYGNLYSNSNGTAWSIFKTDKATKLLSVALTSGNVTTLGSINTPQLYKAGNSGAWVQGRANALIRTTTVGASQYVPLWSAKTQNGSWDCGPYTSDILHFSYITDTNFNAGTNTQTTDIQFTTGGAIDAIKFVKRGGTASQFLKADGSVDSNTYLTSHQSLAAYLKIDGSNGTAAGVSTLINKLTTGTSTPVDADYYVCQAVGGGTSTTTYHRRPMSALWAYIKGKTDSTYATKAVATTSAAGLMSAADKTKVNNTPTFWSGTQAQYDAIATKNNSTVYLIYEE